MRYDDAVQEAQMDQQLSSEQMPSGYTAQLRPLNLDDQGTAPMSSSPLLQKIFMPLCGVVILAGVGTGVGLNKVLGKHSGNGYYNGQPIQQVAGSNITNGQVFGTTDESTFKDSAEGYLEAGGVDGEGSHHLLRSGGASQTVYLTSSITDLSKFEGMQVKVWGETFKGQKAGWLMDVGRVQVENTHGTPPSN